MDSNERFAEDRSIVIKPADKGSCVVVWDKLDYLAEAENHLNDSSTYQDAKFGDDDLVKLVEQSNKIFQKLLSQTKPYPHQSISTFAIIIRERLI